MPGRCSFAGRPAPSLGLSPRSMGRSCVSHASSSPGDGTGSPLRRAAGALGGRAAALLLSALAATPLPLLLAPPPAAAVTNEQLLFLEAWRAVDRAYVDKAFNGQSWFRVRERALKDVPMRDTAQTYAAIRALLASLGDPFTRLLEPEQYAALRRNTAGAVTGVGVEVSFPAAGAADSPLLVVAPAAGGPAERAGVRPLDQILEIDGTPTSALSLYAAGGLLQGAEGSEVRLRVQPAAGGAPRDLTLTRQRIEVNAVTQELCSSSGRYAPGSEGDKLGYIRISSFNKQTVAETRAAIQSLQRGGAQRYVLDLRSNGGGLFPAGVEVGRMWINRGDIVLIADSTGVRDVYEADGSALETAAPLTVLANRGTASAAEVLAGAIKDSGRGRVAGERSFGKGLIQTLVELSDGSALAVTVAKYQTPAGVDINRVGIQPDLELPPAALDALPMNGAGFCRLAAGDAPALF